MSDVKKQFEKATKDVTKVKKDPSNDLKLRLYAHFKQGTEGDVLGATLDIGKARSVANHIALCTLLEMRVKPQF